MSKEIKTERRWLRSVIAASAEPLPSFPWMRGQRRKPAAVQPQQDAAPQRPTLFGKSGAIAAR
jgi:hypothetical protein